MSYVVYTSPSGSSSPGLPPPPLPRAQGFRHEWTGWNGQHFDLTSGEQGVLMLLAGVTGMHLPEFDEFIDEHESVDGGRYRGSRTRVRMPSWTIGIFSGDQGAPSREWRERDVAWWDTMHPERPGMWTITDQDGRSRSLLCRLRSSTEHEYERDPMYAGWAIYTVELLAEQPYWTSPPVSSPVWQVEEGIDFTGPDDEAPPYYVSAAATIDSAKMTNPGDVEAHLTYTIVGPVDSVSIGAAGGEVGFGEVPTGQTLRISTDPTRPVATLDGVDVTGQVEPWDPQPIPASSTTPVTIALTGTGSVQASLTPRHRRAI